MGQAQIEVSRASGTHNQELTHGTHPIPTQGRFQGHLQEKLGPRKQDQRPH